MLISVNRGLHEATKFM